MKKILWLLLALLPILAEAQSGDYFGLVVGKRWTYSNGQMQGISGTKNIAGQKTLVLTRNVPGGAAIEDYLLPTTDGIKLVGSNLNGKINQYDPPLLLYPAPPLVVGMRWSSSSQTNQGQVAYSSRVISSEGLVTVLGRVNALLIRTTVTTASGGQDISNSYFVPSVGTVRFVTGKGEIVDLTSKQ